MSHFTIEHLREGQLAEAGAFLRLTGAESVPGWWENEVRELLGRGGGILAARAADGTLHGLATYEVVRRRHTGRVLEVARLVSFELNRRQPVKHALIHALGLISDAFDCAAVALPLPANGYVRYLSNRIGRGIEPAA